MKAVTPANSYEARGAARALELLHDALLCANTAHCPRLARAIRHAIASARGAQRHMVRRRRVYGVLHVTNTDRAAFRHVEKPARRPLWFRAGQYA
jgi:hypothetical protein